MSRYIPCTEDQANEMLSSIGLSDYDQLFSEIPENLILKEKLNIPEHLSELELIRHIKKLANKNSSTQDHIYFLGAGIYDHFIPSVIKHIVSREEFYTAYTPYQPEISQGTLRAIFEYQTMICELTGMDVANASMYDGSTALAEAMILACKATNRNEIIVSKTVNPEYRRVLSTYARFSNIKIIETDLTDGTSSFDSISKNLSNYTAAIIIQNPNFFGTIEDMDEISQLAHNNKSLFIVSSDPISLAILKSPGEAGADIVTGEGQVLGNYMNFGGPSLGFFAVNNKYARKIPGRVVGETVDRNNNRCYVLTLQAREQHIRRDKATSNICSNQALNALIATIYLTTMGKEGLKEVATQCVRKSRYTYKKLIEANKATSVFDKPFFREFVVKLNSPWQKINEKLLAKKIIGGFPIEKYYSEFQNYVLLAVTEKRTKEEIDFLVDTI